MIYDQIQRNYLFDLNASLVLDGFSRGNQARFINHPDDEVANCYPKGQWLLSAVHLSDRMLETGVLIRFCSRVYISPSRPRRASSRHLCQ